jgi:hypothetical protein
LTEPSTKTKPLLLGISEVLGKPLKVYCMPDVNDSGLPAELKADLVLQISGFPITVERQFEAQVEISFSELLERDIVLYKGNKYSARNVIEWFANKAGGAHYAARIPEDFAEISSEGWVGASALIDALIQLGTATFDAGQNLLKSVVDLEIHAIVAVPRQPEANIGSVNVLFDGMYEGSAMRLTLALNKRLMPIFYARGLQGSAMTVESDRLVDWSEPRYIRVVLTIDDDFGTALELSVDGKRYGRTKIEEPLFVLSDPLSYESFHNRAADGEPQKFSFGVSEVNMFGCELHPEPAADLLLYSMERRADLDVPIILYAPFAYSLAAKGTKNLKMTGDVTRVSARHALVGWSQMEVRHASESNRD